MVWSSPFYFLVALESSEPKLDIGSLQTVSSASTMDWQRFLTRLGALIFLAAGFLAVVFMLYGGILYIVSGGKEEKIEKATHTIRNALIGLVITILAFTIVAMIGRIFGLDLIQYVTFQDIVSTMNSLFTGE